MQNTLFTEHIFRELISSSLTCSDHLGICESKQYLHMENHVDSAMDLPSTEPDRTTQANSLFPEKLGSGSTWHSVTYH